MKITRFKRFFPALLVVCIALSGSVLDARSRMASVKDIKNDIFEKLNKLESKNPSDQAAIFKIKASVDALYKRSIAKTAKTKTKTSKRLEIPPISPSYDFYARCKGLTNDALKRQLTSTMVNMLYQRAQDTVFILLDNFDKKVECVYTGRVIETTTEPNPKDMNIEHTWPQSQGAKGWAKVDLHHLFPTDSTANRVRSNLPFGEVDGASWSEGGSSCDKVCFEVRKKQRGDIARAKFYFAVMYNMKIPAAEEKVLRKWHRSDPPSAYEKKRNDYIYKLQHNRNPFVDKPEFVNLIKDF